MPSAYVLYIEDDIVGPCLNLIRNVCEPRSKARPHITVRYPVDKLHQNDLSAYEAIRIPSVDLTEPGGFGLDERARGPKATVFIKCESDILEGLAYKPDFPDSVFHITCYDGRDLDFADSVLSVLKRFPWDMCVKLPQDTRLSLIPIGASKGRSSTSKPRSYPIRVQEIYREITSEEVSEDVLSSLNRDERLELTSRICIYLHDAIGGGTKATRRGSTASRELSGSDASAAGYDSVAVEKATSLVENPNVKPQGVFLTPPELARSIASFALGVMGGLPTGLRFGDPAIGTGVFFAALTALVPEHRLESSIGIEIDPQRVAGTMNRWSHRGLQVLTGDYLHMERLPSRNLILANPPYVRYQRIPPVTRELLRERSSTQIGIEVSGQASLYVYFLLLSHRWMDHGAVAAWLIPSEFMDTNYGSAVRHYLTHKVQLLRVHRYGLDRVQFENALVSSAVVVFRNRDPEVGGVVEFSSGGSLESPEIKCEVSLQDLRSDTKWLIPRPERNDALESVFRFGDLFDIRRGIATGANGFFMMERSIARSLDIPDEALRPLIPKVRSLRSDVIERGTDGYPMVDPQLCVIDCSLDEHTVKTQLPGLWNYLDSASSEVRNAALVRRRIPWYRQEQREPAPFLCTYMGRGSEGIPALRFLWNKSDAIATNTYLMLYPKASLASALEVDVDRHREIFAILKGTAVGSLVNRGRVYGGGLYKIEPRELLSVPLTTYPSWLDAVLNDRLAI